MDFTVHKSKSTISNVAGALPERISMAVRLDLWIRLGQQSKQCYSFGLFLLHFYKHIRLFWGERLKWYFSKIPLSDHDWWLNRYCSILENFEHSLVPLLNHIALLLRNPPTFQLQSYSSPFDTRPLALNILAMQSQELCISKMILICSLELGNVLHYISWIIHMTAKWVHFSMNAPLEGHSTYSHFAYFCFQHNCNLHIAVHSICSF